MMLDTDFILGQIKAFCDAEGTISGLLSKENTQDAEILLADLYKKLVGISAVMIDYLAAEEIVNLVNLAGVNWIKLGGCAKLIQLEARLCEKQGKAEQALWKQNKAETLMQKATEEAADKEKATGFFTL